MTLFRPAPPPDPGRGPRAGFGQRRGERVRSHPRLLGLGVLAALLVALAGVIIAPATMLVAFTYGVSPEGTRLAAIFLLVLLAVLLVPWLLLRDRGHAHPRAKGRLHARAGAGDVAAMRQVARDYLEGRHGTPRDDSQGLWWLRRLAEGGDLTAAVELARHLRTGRGILRDPVQAREWLRHAAEHGSGQAKHLLDLWDREGS
jgi:hypothetical protein